RRAGAPLPAEPRRGLPRGGHAARPGGPDRDLPDRPVSVRRGERGLRGVLLGALPRAHHRGRRGAAEGRACRDGRHRLSPMSAGVSLQDIEHAREVVADVARETQVIESRYLSRTTGGTIALKAENLQRTGSFKLRGALNKIAALEPSAKGVVTASAGNHGQSLAY